MIKQIAWGVSGRPLAVARRRFCAKAPTVQNGADSRFVHLKRGRRSRDVRCQIDNRPGVQAAIRPAIRTPANARRERVVHRRVAEGAWDAHGFDAPGPPRGGIEETGHPGNGVEFEPRQKEKEKEHGSFHDWMVAVARLQVALPRLPGFFVCPATPKNSGPQGSFRQLPESLAKREWTRPALGGRTGLR